MSLSSTADYQLLVNKLLWYIDNNMSGIDRYGLPVYAKIEPSDFATIMAAYDTHNFDGSGNQLNSTGYKVTREAKPSVTDASGNVTYVTELYPNGHGANGTSFSNGAVIVLPAGNPVEPVQTPPTWPNFG